MPSRFGSLITGLLIALAQPATAQQVVPVPATPPLQFESWQAAALDRRRGLCARSRNRRSFLMRESWGKYQLLTNGGTEKWAGATSSISLFRQSVFSVPPW